MGRSYVLYNPLSNNKTGEAAAKRLKDLTNDDLVFQDVTTISNYASFFETLVPEDKVILCGGDGTLNHFINDIDGIEIENKVYLFAAGSGNDFLRDINAPADQPVEINKYLKDLPSVTVNGIRRKMINGIGYGIDGYCCAEGDKQRATDSTKKINYTAIAIKGLLFHYKPTSAKVTVDGKEYNFSNVWLAPTMHGRCYGGGMYPTPDQDRLHAGHKVSVLVFTGKSKIATLMLFPKIFSGEHLKNEKACRVLTGSKVTVEFDRPAPAQIDGETILEVTRYDVEA